MCRPRSSVVRAGRSSILAKSCSTGSRAARSTSKWAHLRSLKAFDRNLVVIGAGSAGLVTACHRGGRQGEGDADRNTRWAATAQHRLRAVKALIVGQLLSQMKHAEESAWRARPTWNGTLRTSCSVQRVVSEVEPHDSIERYTELGVECLTGTAVKIARPGPSSSPQPTARNRHHDQNIVIASGRAAFVPPGSPALDSR